MGYKQKFGAGCNNRLFIVYGIIFIVCFCLAAYLFFVSEFQCPDDPYIKAKFQLFYRSMGFLPALLGTIATFTLLGAKIIEIEEKDDHLLMVSGPLHLGCLTCSYYQKLELKYSNIVSYHRPNHRIEKLVFDNSTQGGCCYGGQILRSFASKKCCLCGEQKQIDSMVMQLEEEDVICCGKIRYKSIVISTSDYDALKKLIDEKTNGKAIDLDQQQQVEQQLMDEIDV